MCLLGVFQWQDEAPVPCDPKEICPAGSWKPEEECKGLYKRNNKTEVTQVTNHSVVFNQGVPMYMYELWVKLLS